MALIFSSPIKGLSWTPSAMTNEYWLRSDQAVLSGSNVTSWTNLSPTGSVPNVGFTGTAPAVQTAAVNGRDSFLFATNTIGTLTSPTTLTVVDTNTPFCLSYVHKGPSLAVDTFYALFTLSGASAASSMTLFYTALTGLPVFYFQNGNSTVTLVKIPNFDITQWHYVAISYNGGGDFSNGGNWKIYLNGVSQTITTNSTSGGNTAHNQIGDGSGGGAANAGQYTEVFMSPSQQLVGGDLVGVRSYYKLLYNLG